MKKYSQYDLIGEEMLRLNIQRQPRRFLERLEDLFFNAVFSKYNFSLKIPNHVYFRAKILCEDVKDLSGYNFEVQDLIYLLYRSFLHSVKEIDDPLSIYNLVFVRINSKPQVKKSGNFITLNYREEAIQYVNISLKKKYVLRGEVLLRDLENIVPGHSLTVETILETIFLDFIKEYQSGNSRNIINELINKLDEIEE